MAKKRASAKPKGLDDSGKPIDLKQDAANTIKNARATADRLEAEFSRIKKPNALDRFEYKSDIKRNLRNVQDIKLNKTTFNAGKGLQTKSPTAIPMPAATALDKISGRTPEFGTRSLLEGMKSFMRGGGLRSGRM